MALGRVKSWNDGDVLFAADQNAEFNNILNNPIALVSPTTGPINFNGQAHTGLLPSAISATSGSTGDLVAVLPSGSVGFVNVGQALSRVSGLIGSLSSQIGTFSADGYQMRSSSSLTWVVSATSAYSVSLNNDGPVAGGKDKTGAFAGTEVHWYAITTGPGSTSPAGLVSTQAPPQGPILPAGYSGWAYLGGSPYIVASSTVATAHVFRGGRAQYNTGGPTVLNNGTAVAQTAVSVSSAVPINALTYTLAGQVNPSADGGGGCDVQLHIRSVSGSNQYAPRFGLFGLTPAAFQVYSWPLGPVTNTSSQQFLYLHTVNTGTIGNGTTLTITDYTMPNGDV